MHAENFKLEDYLQRIGYHQKPARDLATLVGLMRAQLFSVPFENLDVQAGKIVSMVREDIVDKIVYRRRGGYCYEVNGLFAMALTALGFDYTLVGARPMFYPMRWAKTHMVLVVNLDGEEWLCDAGFGSFGIRAPLSLAKAEQVIQQDDDFFKISKSDERNFIMQARVDGDWVNQYTFDLYPHEWVDFYPANFFNSRHPDTVFVQKLLVVKHSEQGRYILLGNRLKVIEKGITSVRELSDKEVAELLASEFGRVV